VNLCKSDLSIGGGQ